MTPSPGQIVQLLRSVIVPGTERDIIRRNQVRNLQVSENRVAFTLEMNSFGPEVDAVVDRCHEVLKSAFGDGLEVQIETDAGMIDLGDMVQQTGAQGQKISQPGVVNMLAVASGKGGVGKSTVAVNLALALQKLGYDVGLVDTDIYGPSIPIMLGMEGEKPRVNEERKIIPLEKHGLKVLSMGFLVDQEQAVIWRGPMVSSAVRQFLGDAEWGELDYLILDLPPGTGDIQLTIVQTVPLTGAVIVSTPQDVALADARKGVAMFRNVHVPVLGIIENMAYFTPPDLPDRKYYLFGRGGAQRLAERIEAPFLGEVPIEQSVREGGDEGRPIMVSDPDSVAAKAFAGIAGTVIETVALRNAEQPPTQSVDILHR
jgi:ATP-binding protein involved in chromosome partitioning